MDDAITKMISQASDMLGRAWDFVQWFAGFVISTVADSVLGGWTAVLALAVVALILFLVTRIFHHEG
ncbi:MAG: hypothetical protein GC190_09645 [Alphaproteobacteria bacterium]|nr:hypothetical protein [Alphaproteobacteria bacterium]